VAIVWLCPVSVDVAEGRSVVVPRPSCPSCLTPMRFWSGYRRWVRVGDRFLRVWVRRARCSGCGRSHGLIPSFLLRHRQDAVVMIGDAVAEIAGGATIGATARRCGVPFTTVRGWWRRFRLWAPVWWSGFAALTIEFGGTVPARWPTGPPAAAVAAIGWADAAATARHPAGVLPVWGFVSVIVGGLLIGPGNTTPPWRVFGNRRFMPPTPTTG
jgi:uncharacterized protein DUF6431/helix-turn-helix protein